MAVIVRNRKTRARYVLIGTGFGAFRATAPHWFMGNMSPETKEGELALVAVCDLDGRVGWLDSDDIEVISVDGKSPGELLT